MENVVKWISENSAVLVSGLATILGGLFSLLVFRARMLKELRNLRVSVLSANEFRLHEDMKDKDFIGSCPHCGKEINLNEVTWRLTDVQEIPNDKKGQ